MPTFSTLYEDFAPKIPEPSDWWTHTHKKTICPKKGVKIKMICSHKKWTFRGRVVQYLEAKEHFTQQEANKRNLSLEWPRECSGKRKCIEPYRKARLFLFPCCCFVTSPRDLFERGDHHEMERQLMYLWPFLPKIILYLKTVEVFNFPTRFYLNIFRHWLC